MFGVRLQLRHETGHEVDRATHLRELQQMQGHAVVVLDAVQANPGHRILTGHIVRVVRLVLVPEESERDFGHTVIFEYDESYLIFEYSCS